MSYRVEILDNTLTAITWVKALVPLDTSGTVVEYSTKLSSYGQAKFRVATKDPLHTTFGDILKPYANHARIYRNNLIVWQGVIIDNPTRNKKFIEVVAYEYEYLLTKILIRHDTSGDVNYRTFNSGTMAATINTLLTEAKSDAGTNILSGMNIGAIENPVFPAGYVDFNNADISGQSWAFSQNFYIKYDYRDIFYVLQSLAVYGVCDFKIAFDPIAKTLTFNFKKFLGNKQPKLMFEYGAYGSIEDYDAPLIGSSMANYLVGVAADTSYNILKVDQTDTVSIGLYGKVAGVAAYSDVKTKNLLTTRVAQELLISSTPDSEVNVILNDKAYPLGVYGVGDTVTFRIHDHIINVNELRRIIDINVRVNDQGKEFVKLVTNPPRPDQV